MTESVGERETYWLEFPFGAIVARLNYEEFASRFVWLAIPLEYYLLTIFTGGVDVLSLPIVFISLLTISIAILFSCVLALLTRNGTAYSVRIRTWAVALLLQWVTSLLMLTIGYLIGRRFTSPDTYYDIVYLKMRSLPSFSSYPGLLDPRTYAVYVVYSTIAALVIKLGVRVVGARTFSAELPRGPNVIVTVLVTAAIMMFIHGITRLAG